jgi:hypothetical protein
MTKSESSRAAQSYANNWGSDIKVEIPETGISIGELRDFLREWLGHDIHMSGEIFRTADGIAVTARAGGEEGATFTGKESDLDALVQKAAEHVYEVTQPYRYANYLDRNYDPKGLAQRIATATEVYRRLIAGDDKKEQAWAWNGLATIQFNFYADNRKSSRPGTTRRRSPPIPISPWCIIPWRRATRRWVRPKKISCTKRNLSGERSWGRPN